jgi:DNA-binding SARP family transcriptional activator
VVEAGGAVRPVAGWKPWGLLARLVLADRAPSRGDLAELLWPTADDPAAALRWALHQLRKALGPEATIIDRGGRLALDGAGVSVDALELLEGSVSLDRVEDVARGNLLEGLHFAGAPGFELWLGIEQARLDSALRSTLRWAATLSVSGDPDRALRLITRALALDPFDDAAHELAIEIHVLRGDARAAQGHLDRVTRLYRTELGTVPPPRMRRPLDRPVQVPRNPLIDRGIAASATLDIARARLAAGEYDTAIASARRASLDAAAAGDPVLEARALTLLAEGLIHGRRGLDLEAVGLLDRALRLAIEAGSLDLAADIEREAGYVAFLAADYGAAEVALHRSLTLARRSGDQGRIGRAMTILAACRSDEGALDAAQASIDQALDALDVAGDRRWHAYALSFLARIRLAAGAPAEAVAVARRAVTAAREAGWTALVPFPMTFEGEGLLAAGDGAAAAAVFGKALTMAEEMGDPCWEALSLRGLALVEGSEGRAAEGLAIMARALDSCRRFPDTYKWAEILILTELVELEHGTDRVRHNDARRLAHDAGLAQLVGRIDRASERQTLPQTPRS